MKSKNTYSLILNADSEDKGSSIIETAVYGLVILCMALGGWQVASSKVTVPGQNRVPKSQQSIMATAPVEQGQPLIASRG